MFGRTSKVAASALCAVVLALFVLIAGVARASYDEPGYHLPLFKHWEIVHRRYGHGELPTETLRSLDGPGDAMVEEFGPTYGLHSLRVDAYATIDDRWIVGSGPDGFFIFDTRRTSGYWKQRPQLFTKRDEWIAALAAAGLPTDVTLRDPDVVAATLPSSTTQPADYRRMQGALGMSDEAWAGALPLATMGLCVFFGFIVSDRRPLFMIAVMLAVGINVAANGIIAGGGPEFAMGFIVYPPLFIFLANIGWWLSRLRGRRTPSRVLVDSKPST